MSKNYMSITEEETVIVIKSNEYVRQHIKNPLYRLLGYILSKTIEPFKRRKRLKRAIQKTQLGIFGRCVFAYPAKEEIRTNTICEGPQKYYVRNIVDVKKSILPRLAYEGRRSFFDKKGKIRTGKSHIPYSNDLEYSRIRNILGYFWVIFEQKMKVPLTILHGKYLMSNFRSYVKWYGNQSILVKLNFWYVVFTGIIMICAIYK